MQNRRSSRMRIPYVVGKWVRGSHHYGRQRLISYLLSVQDSATWLVGTRRMGKTSLLRQLEYVTSTQETDYVPLVWDLQGCQNPESMSAELEYAVSETRPRFDALGIDATIAPGSDAVAILRTLSRNTEWAGKRLLLLVDEAEALLNVAEVSPAWLAMLRKVFQEGSMRSIITSTKLLVRLNDKSTEWNTSPFFFGFNMANLWALDIEPSLALIRQKQSPSPVQVQEDTARDIITNTNGHPYLMQYLCQRLFVVDGEGRPALRSIADEDLNPDHILSGFFQIDFLYLTEIERRLLLTIADNSVLTTDDLVTDLSNEQPRRIEMYLYGLRKLGYLRSSHDRLTIGNEYMRRWIQEHRHELDSVNSPGIDDVANEAILREERRNEASFLRFEIDRLQEQLVRVEEANNRTAFFAGPERQALTRIRMDLVRAHRELDKISVGLRNP